MDTSDIHIESILIGHIEFTLGTENAVHSTCVFTPVIPYCRRADVIVGGPFK